jgi:hypothetical protein
MTLLKMTSASYARHLGVLYAETNSKPELLFV